MADGLLFKGLPDQHGEPYNTLVNKYELEPENNTFYLSNPNAETLFTGNKLLIIINSNLSRAL